MARNDQLIRQLKLLQLLEASRYGRTLAELCDDLTDDLGLSRLSDRTVRRDLEALQAAGFDVDSHQLEDRRTVWKLGPGWQTPPKLQATATELLALAMSRDLLLPLMGTPFWQGIESLWKKLEESLPASVWKHVEKQRQSLVVRGQQIKHYDRQQGILATLNRAIQQHRVVEIQYRTLGSSQNRLRHIEPFALALYRGSLYVVAVDHEMKESQEKALEKAESESADRPIKHFKLDRFAKATALDVWFTPPADFDADDHFSGSLGVYKSGDPMMFRIKLRGYAAAWAQEDPWHPEQDLQPAPPTDSTEETTPSSEMILTVPSAYESEIVPRVLALGPDAELLEPRETRERLVEQLQSALQVYQPEA